ncbi:hypothetical protein, conserved [Leishmania tarentolae]|uniref:Protein artemis n=1 Tax=Leishmania tarentolae TaxID=5689 RepID=A0A640KS16_LEITA|nr:hypothetical protein, conserved [Leishmania tarentolae]
MKSSRSKAGAAASSIDRDNSRREYFKSREVYRGSQGTILVDAFRFLYHHASATDSAGEPKLPAALSGNSMTPSGARYSATAPVFSQGPGLVTTSRLARPHTFYFLSHFHSDHYAGITNLWHSGTIYCSRPTAALTQSQLGVPSSWLFPMDLGKTYIFSLSTGVCLSHVPETPHHPCVQAVLSSSATPSRGEAQEKNDDGIFAVRLIQANHCPGAVMFLFVSPVFGTVLHTGDFRFNGSQQTWQQVARSSNIQQTCMPSSSRLLKRSEEHHASTTATPAVVVPPAPLYEQFIGDDEALREVAQRQLLDVLFLDNTFCAPAYQFPSQWEATQRVIAVVRSLFHRAAHRACVSAPSSEHPRRPQVRCAVLIGSYMIGKERVVLALRDAFPLAKSSEQRQARHPIERFQPDVEASETASWKIHVSPSRYALLSSIGFFKECFEPLKASSESKAGTAHVEDVPVRVPLILDECKTQCPPLESAAIAAPFVQRSLKAGSDALVGTGNSSSAKGPAEEVEHLLSVFLVPMACVGYRAVAALAHADGPAVVNIEDELVLNLDRYDEVLIVEPTGWCRRCVVREVSRKYTLLRVPYSEHCAFHELLEFVKLVNPARIVPTVSEESFKQYEALFLEKAPRLRSRLSAVQPITQFLMLPVSPVEAPAGQGKETMESIVPRSALCAVCDGLSVSLAGITPAEDPAVADPETPTPGSSVTRKRARAKLPTARISASTSTTKVVSATSSIMCTLERLFRKAPRDTVHTSSETTCLDEVVVSEDDECQVVGVVQAVVEISDDD